MKTPDINLRDLVFLVADPNPHLIQITREILGGFGVRKMLHVNQSADLYKALVGQKVDILLCDAALPPLGGLTVTRTIRRNPDNENRTIPILIMTSDTRGSTIKNARDVGANMVVAKPMSPNTLYQRLSWIAFNARPFVDTATYFGPDRRFKIEGYPDGVGRRKTDKPVEIAAEVGQALAQNDIDSLFSASRTA